MSIDVQTRVAAGVAFLDRQVPGWVDRIDVDNLNVASPVNCVLGQLYGMYSSGISALGLDQDQAAALGFQVEVTGDSFSDFVRALVASAEEYPALTDEWRRVIEILKAPADSKEKTLAPV